MSKKISTLAVDLTANTAKFEKKLTQARKKSRGFADEMARVSKRSAAAMLAIGVGATAGLAILTKEMDAAGKTASKLGLTTEELTSLRFAVEQTSDVTAGQFDTALQRMTRRLAEAKHGTGEARGAIKELGLEAVNLAALSPGEAFKKIADQMSEVADQEDRVRLAFKLFDTEGVGLVNTLGQGSDAIEKLQQEAIDLGVAFDDKAAAGAANFNDQIGKLQGAAKGAFIQFVNGSGIVDSLAIVFEDLNYAISESRKESDKVQGSFDGVVSFAKLVITTLNTMGAAYEALQYKIGLAYAVLNTEVGFDTFKNIGYHIDGYNEKIDALYSRTEAFNKRIMEGKAGANAGISNGGGVTNLPRVNVGGGGGSSSTQKARVGGDWRSMLDSQTGEFDTESERSMSQIETLDSVYETQIEREQTFRDRRLDIVNKALESETISTERAAALRQKIEKKYQNAQIKTVGDGLGVVSQLMQTNSKEAFEIGKKAAIAQSVINTYQMAVGAYNSLASIPYVGPFLGAAAAAAAVVFGMQQVSSIRSQQFTPSARSGFDIPAGVNPLTQLHEQEMVLPKAQANVIRDLANGNGGNGQAIVNIYNAPTQPKVTQTGKVINIEFITEAVSERMAGEVLRGVNPMNNAIEASYGLYR